MLRRSGITVSRKRVYRLMKLTNLVKKRRVRKHLVRRRELVVPKGPNELWEQDITYEAVRELTISYHALMLWHAMAQLRRTSLTLIVTMHR